MLGKLKALFSKTDPSHGQKQTAYKDAQRFSTAEQKQILESGDDCDRLALAADSSAEPEVLYYLSEDKNPQVRENIARNSATPLQADKVLTRDEDDDVRSELARKIARIIPGLATEETLALREKTIEILETLAADQTPKVRAIIAEEIKTSLNVPKGIIDQLARDTDETVSLPVLAYSPLLHDDDLREIIAAGASSDALEAIARRKTVSEDISNELATTLDIPAIAALLTNKNAQIREDTLDQIIDQASDIDDLHKPLALRPQLSLRAMKRIAGFVASALVHAMMEENKLPEADAEDLLDRVRDRLQSERASDSDEAKYAKTASDLFRRGVLDDAFVIQQIAENNRELLLQCLALLSDLPAPTVRKIIHSKSGRAVTALAWKAKLTMRTAYSLQTQYALVPTAQLLAAKDGKDYPIDDDELEWHLSYFVEQN